MRLCPRCKQEKPLTDFYRERAGRGGYGYHCKKCRNATHAAYCAKNADRLREYRRENNRKIPAHVHRANKLSYHFGMTIADFDKMLAAQDGRCAICGTDKPGGKGAFHVDHDHRTGQVRGLLCSACNTGLGHLGDDPMVLFVAMKYLEAR